MSGLTKIVETRFTRLQNALQHAGILLDDAMQLSDEELELIEGIGSVGILTLRTIQQAEKLRQGGLPAKTYRCETCKRSFTFSGEQPLSQPGYFGLSHPTLTCPWCRGNCYDIDDWPEQTRYQGREPPDTRS